MTVTANCCRRSKWWVYADLEYFPHWRETEAVTSISCVYLTDICLQNSPKCTNSKNTLRSVSCIHRDEAEKTACGTITLSSVCWTVLSCVLLVACNSSVILSTSWYESEVINMSNVLLKCQCGASTCGLQKRYLPTFYPGDVVLFLRVWFCGLCRRFIDDRRCFSKFSHKSSVNMNSAPSE